MPHHAAILAVGSELLSGQITNGNAAWISARLFRHGTDVKEHLTVDDDEQAIIRGLSRLASEADLIFVTGGLGPTSDDLTRQSVAAWCGQPLVFDPESWEHIVRAFKKFARDVPEANRQQCFFPQSATVLTNNAGTANAFMLTHHGKELWVLPGPPHEVATVWAEHIEKALSAKVPAEDRLSLKMWRVVGKGESHLAELVEPLLVGQGAQIAYRAHAPYVELKLRFPAANATHFANLAADIEAAIKPWLYEKDDQDVPTQLASELLAYAAVDIYDGATQGSLLEALGPSLRKILRGTAHVNYVTSWEGSDDPRAFVEQALALNSEGELALAIAGYDGDGQWALGMRRLADQVIQVYPSLYRGDAMRARNQKAIAALAAKAWLQLLTEREHTGPSH